MSVGSPGNQLGGKAAIVGIGVALDYPLHRHTLLAKQIELTLGSGTPQLVKLGEML